MSAGSPTAGPEPLRSPLTIAVVGIAAALGAVRVVRHEMWRDEVQVWSLARFSDSVPDLIGNMRYEGHPPLWHVLVFLLTRVTADPHAMQALHGVIAVATALVVWRYAPFPRWSRVALLLSYYPAYEYLAISRAYGLGLLLVVVACALGTRDAPRWGLVAAALSLLALTSVYGVFLSAALAAAFLVRRVRVVGRSARPGPALIAGAAALVASVVASALFMRPPSGAAPPFLEPSWTTAEGVLEGVGRALVPLPSSREGIWGTNLLDTGPDPTAWAVVIAVVVLVAVAVGLRRSPEGLVLWVVASALILLFAYTQFLGAYRHLGHLAIALIAAAWLAGRTYRAGPVERPAFAWRTGLSPVLVPLLAVHVIAGVVVSLADLRRPFSHGERIAATLGTVIDAETVVIADGDYATSGASAWLDRPLYFPSTDALGTYVVWGRRTCAQAGNAACVPPEDVLADARRVAREQGRPDAVLLLNYPVDAPGVTLVASAQGALVGDENFWIYRLDAG